MRVSCLFVSVAIMLAGEMQSLPIVGLGSLPVLGNEAQLVNSLSNTLRPVPLAGNLTGELLEHSADEDLLSEADLAGPSGLISSEGTLGGLVGSLQRRQGLPLIGALGSVANGIEGMPVLGSVGSALPVTQAVTSNVGSLNGGLPNVKNLGTGLHKLLPVSALTLLKRDGATSALSSIPLIGSFPGASSLPLINSVPSFSSLPLAHSVPSFSNLPLISSVPSFSNLPLISSAPKLTSLPLISSVPGFGQLSSGLPSPAGLGRLL